MTLQLAILLVVGVPLVAVTQPFLPRRRGGWRCCWSRCALLVVAFWRSATNLQGHVRAGAQVIVEALAAQSASDAPAAGARRGRRRLLPGLGNARAVRLAAASPALGRTLQAAQSARADRRDGDRHRSEADGVVYPTGDETLATGDTLILTGTAAAVEAARGILGSVQPG